MTIKATDTEDLTPDVDLVVDEDKDLENADFGDNLDDDKGNELGDDKGKDDADDKGKDDAAGDDKGKDDADDKGDDQNFPVRLNKAKAQRDAATLRAEAAERELAELKNSKLPAKEDDKVDPIKDIEAKLDDLYEKVEDARADGDTKEAARLQREIDKSNRALAAHEASVISQRTTAGMTEAQRFDAMLDTMEAALPQLTCGHEDFDPGQVKELEELVAGYEAIGHKSTKALEKAVKVMFNVNPFAPATKASVKDDKKADDKKANDKKDDKKKDASAEKAIDTSKRQPPAIDDLGANKDDVTIKVSSLSEDEFDKLPEATKAKLRGDYL